MRYVNLVLASTALMFSSTALAFHCPADMAEIDEALAAEPDISAEEMAEVRRLRAEGEKLHNEGDHQGSVDVLAEAKNILDI